MKNNLNTDVICALSTPSGEGALAIVRMSGNGCIALLDQCFSKDLLSIKSHHLLYGDFMSGKDVLDEVVVGVFRHPHSFTGEDMVEISCHGSMYIVQQILQTLLKNGARMATKGEFSMRAFLNGKMDLSQAEGVADLIASRTSAAHKLAMSQLKGGFSNKIKQLRDELVKFASLIELELDFSEEDVAFADRKEFRVLIDNILQVVSRLADSFNLGNAIKNGIPVVITGPPNVGKSTLLNLLLNEEKALVSDIPGTTRDAIEDEVVIEGVGFRLIDTAGIRKTSDVIEKMGINRTFEKLKQAFCVLFIFDVTTTTPKDVISQIKQIQKAMVSPKPIIPLANKTDKFKGKLDEYPKNTLGISALKNHNIDVLKQQLVAVSGINEYGNDEVVVTNARHYDSLIRAKDSLLEVKQGIDNVSSELLATDIRRALHFLSSIIGEVSTETLLDEIFSKFCIGK